MADNLNVGIGIEHQGTDKATMAMKRMGRVMLGTLKTMGGVNKAAVGFNSGFSDKLPAVNKALGETLDLLISFKNPLEGIGNLAGKVFGGMVDGIEKTYEVGKDLEQRWTRLANVFGSDQMADRVNKWHRELHSELPIVTDDLNDLTFQMNKFGINPEMINVKGILEAAHGPAMDFNNAMSAMINLAEGGAGGLENFREALNFKVDSEAIRTQLRGLTTVQERMIAISNFYEDQFAGGVERTNKTVAASFTRINNVFQDFWEAVAGTPGDGGFMGELQNVLKDIADWFVSNRKLVMKFGRTMSKVLGHGIKVLVKAFKPLTDRFLSFFKNTDKALETFKRGAAKVSLFLSFLGNELKHILENPKKAFMDFASWIGKGFVNLMVDGLVYGLQGLGSVLEKTFKKIFFGSEGFNYAAAGGAAIGGLIGSVFGPVGAAIGATIGAAIGPSLYDALKKSLEPFADFIIDSIKDVMMTDWGEVLYTYVRKLFTSGFDHSAALAEATKRSSNIKRRKEADRMFGGNISNTALSERAAAKGLIPIKPILPTDLFKPISTLKKKTPSIKFNKSTGTFNKTSSSLTAPSLNVAEVSADSFKKDQMLENLRPDIQQTISININGSTIPPEEIARKVMIELEKVTQRRKTKQGKVN